MTGTYQTTGINLKGMALGEADRLVTILSPEFGLIRAVAPGARKHKSKLRGRSELFVVNELLLVKGRSLDKIIQADTVESYPGLSKELGKLTAAQYLAELVLCIAQAEQASGEYQLLNEHLRRIEKLPKDENIYPYLAQAVFHLLAVAGICPQVHACCLTGETLAVDTLNSDWRGGFSFDAGGLINLSNSLASQSVSPRASTPATTTINSKIGAVELNLLQQLGAQSLATSSATLSKELVRVSLDAAWYRVERILRDYAQYHFGRKLRSADLVDALLPLEF